MSENVNNTANEEVQVNADNPVQGAETKTNGKMYTEEEINALLQKEGDRRISQYQKTMEKKQRESEKLRNMSDEDKRIYQLDQREAELSRKEAELAMLENKSEGLGILAEKNLDAKLINYVLDSDAEVMYGKIKEIESIFKKAVKAEVEKRLGSPQPKAGIGVQEMTKEQFNKLSIKEWQRISQEDPELFKRMTE